MTFDWLWRHVAIFGFLAFAVWGLVQQARIAIREHKGERSGEDEYLSALRRICGGDGWRW